MRLAALRRGQCDVCVARAAGALFEDKVGLYTS
jgi:hypothetical protein